MVCFASLALGARPISLETFIQAFTGFDPSNGDHAVVHSRIPRTVTGLLVGAALGLQVPPCRVWRATRWRIRASWA